MSNELQLLPEFVKLRNNYFSIPDYMNSELMMLTIASVFFGKLFPNNDSLKDFVESMVDYFDKETGIWNHEIQFNWLLGELLNKLPQNTLNFKVSKKVVFEVVKDLNLMYYNNQIKPIVNGVKIYTDESAIQIFYYLNKVMYPLSINEQSFNRMVKDSKNIITLKYTIVSGVIITIRSLYRSSTYIRGRINNVIRHLSNNNKRKLKESQTKYISPLVLNEKSIEKLVINLTNDDINRLQLFTATLLRGGGCLNDENLIELLNLSCGKPINI